MSSLIASPRVFRSVLSQLFLSPVKILLRFPSAPFMRLAFTLTTFERDFFALLLATFSPNATDLNEVYAGSPIVLRTSLFHVFHAL